MQPVTAAEEKASLRREVKARLECLSSSAWEASNQALLQQFWSLPVLQETHTIFLYYGMGREFPTARLIPFLLKAGKQVALPRCLPGRQMEARLWDGTAPLVRHPYGMWEPESNAPLCSPEQLELILVPGLCFDSFGFRLGYGGGYYDRYLNACNGVTVGLCRDCFLFPRLPHEVHDLPVDFVITETAIRKTRPPKGGPAFPLAGIK